MTQDPFSDKAAQDFLTGGAPAAKFPKEGFVWGGTVIGWEMAQQTDMETQEPKVDKQGRKMMQLVLTMQGEPTGVTWETNAYKEVTIPDDDGIRRLFVKGALQFALARAMKDAGGKLEEGVYIEVTRTKDKPPVKKGWGGAHQFTATWTKAEDNPRWAKIQSDAATDALLSGTEDPFAK